MNLEEIKKKIIENTKDFLDEILEWCSSDDVNISDTIGFSIKNENWKIIWIKLEFGNNNF